MSDYLAAEDSFINSIVGEGTKFTGDIELQGLLRIDGDFSGSITTDGKVLVGRHGRAECDVRAGTVVIGGALKGNVYATEKVIILSTGIIIGNIEAPRLIVEDGVIINGEITVSGIERVSKGKKAEHDFQPAGSELNKAKREFAETDRNSNGSDNAGRYSGGMDPEEIAQWKA